MPWDPGMLDGGAALIVKRTKSEQYLPIRSESAAYSMVYRKGELTPAAIDRGWPHQVSRREAACTGANHKVHLDFCRDLSLCPRGHSVYHEHTTWRVFCFADPAH